MGERAQNLAAALGVSTLTGTARVLADQAVIITERLEELDRVLNGHADTWLAIHQKLAGLDIAELVISQPLAEERQQAMALKGVLLDLAKVMDLAPAVPVASTSDDLKTQREKRRLEASGGLL